MRRGRFNGVKSACLILLYYVGTARHRRQQAGHYAIIKRGLPERALFSHAIIILLISHAGATYQNAAKRPLLGLVIALRLVDF